MACADLVVPVLLLASCYLPYIQRQSFFLVENESDRIHRTRGPAQSVTDAERGVQQLRLSCDQAQHLPLRADGGASRAAETAVRIDDWMKR